MWHDITCTQSAVIYTSVVVMSSLMCLLIINSFNVECCTVSSVNHIMYIMCIVLYIALTVIFFQL